MSRLIAGVITQRFVVGASVLLTLVWGSSVVGDLSVAWPGHMYIGASSSMVRWVYYFQGTGTAELMADQPALRYVWYPPIGWPDIFGEWPSAKGGRNDEYLSVSCPIWLLFLPLGVLGFLARRAKRKMLQAGNCRKCGYDLTDNVSGRCPECGTPTREVKLRSEST